MVSEPLLSGWLNMSREEGERTGSLRSNRDREWLILPGRGIAESEGILSFLILTAQVHETTG